MIVLHFLLLLVVLLAVPRLMKVLCVGEEKVIRPQRVPGAFIHTTHVRTSAALRPYTVKHSWHTRTHGRTDGSALVPSRMSPMGSLLSLPSYLLLFGPLPSVFSREFSSPSSGMSACLPPSCCRGGVPGEGGAVGMDTSTQMMREGELGGRRETPMGGDSSYRCLCGEEGENT